MAEQAGPTDGQVEVVVEQVLRLAQGDAQMGAARAGQQARTRTDVGAGQFQVAAPLAGPLTLPAAVDVPAVAMPLDLRLRDVGDEMVVEGVGGFEVGRAAMGTLRGMDIVFEERRVRRWLLAHGSGVLAMLLAAAVSRRAGPGRAFRRGTLAALVDLLELVLHLRQAAPQFGVLRLQFGVLRLEFQESLLQVHNDRSLAEMPETASELLNSYEPPRPGGRRRGAEIKQVR